MFVRIFISPLALFIALEPLGPGHKRFESWSLAEPRVGQLGQNTTCSKAGPGQHEITAEITAATDPQSTHNPVTPVLWGLGHWLELVPPGRGSHTCLTSPRARAEKWGAGSQVWEETNSRGVAGLWLQHPASALPPPQPSCTYSCSDTDS